MSGPRRASWTLGAWLLFACTPPDPPLRPEPGESLPGGATTNTLMLGKNAFIRPVANLTEENAPLFYAGNSFFNTSWVAAPASAKARDGLGPLFNARSCSGCHMKDGRGRPPATVDEDFVGLLLRISIPGAGPHGEPIADPAYGGQIQPHANPGLPAEAHLSVTYTEQPGTYEDGEAYTLLKPTYLITQPKYGPLPKDLMVSPRVAQSVHGLGLVEAIPEARLRALADPDDADADGISGRVSEVWDPESRAFVMGRFGWKASQPTLRAQAAAAFLGDIGMTTTEHPNQECTKFQPECAAAPNGGGPEITPAQMDRVERYLQLLAVPVRRDWQAPETLAGKATFKRIGCAGCHTPSHITGDSTEVPELAGHTIWPYTNMLLHDMGPELADNRPLFNASGTEWRTAPLWGLGLVPTVNGHDRLLHDGRARGVAEAILWHGGEAESSRESFRKLPRTDRRALVRFVESL